MHKLNKEKEIIGFYLSAHPLDEFKYQYRFLQGVLSRKEILESRKEEFPDAENVILPVEIADEKDSDDDLLDIPADISADGEDEILIEETVRKVEPKGSFSFLNLDEVEAFRDIAFAGQQKDLFDTSKLSWKEKMALKDKGKEYTVAGLVTDYQVRDGKNSGEKIAFLTLEDYSGSCSFRLGDRDYMKFRDRIDVQRFLILKIKYVQVSDGRVFINISDVIDLKDAFEKFARSLTIVMDVNDLRRGDIEFFKENVFRSEGRQKLSFIVRNPEDDSQVELYSLKSFVDLDGDLLEVFSQGQKFKVFLN